MVGVLTSASRVKKAWLHSSVFDHHLAALVNMLALCRHTRKIRPSWVRCDSTSSKNNAPPRPPARQVPVDEFCIPLDPPYSIHDFIPPATPLSREVLLKLHTLSALNPPETEEGWAELDSLGGLVAIMEGVRLSATAHSHKNDEVGLADGRVRAIPSQIDLSQQGKADTNATMPRDGIMKLAAVTSGNYYVVRTPDGIRAKVVNKAD